MMNFATGSLVHARGREWVVMPGDELSAQYSGQDCDCLLLRPLGGSDDETIGILTDLEDVTPAAFSLPDPEQVGDAFSCGLLRDAVRLGFRSTTGPFRSFGHIAVEPRPYQLVPLLMAMRLDPVRLLIADDVGIGKTIEAGLIAREMLDRGEIRRTCVLCPPQVAEQWQRELAEKFHIESVLVLPSTVRRLVSGLPLDKSIFDVYPHTIVSLDYIKSERNRDSFARTCPEFVIVDEAHSCASARGGRGTMQRHAIVRDLAASKRHMLFVTATPHSGKEDVFRSLLCFLDQKFANLPEDLSGKANEAARRELARYFVQRRRGDILAYMNTRTVFPQRETLEKSWKMSPAASRFLDHCLALARKSLERTSSGSKFQQRVSWWSALALLRCVASSPAAAAATLRSRATGLDLPEDPDLVDDIGRQTVFDVAEDVQGLAGLNDTMPGADATELGPDENARKNWRESLLRLAREAEALCGPADKKLAGMVEIARDMLKNGYSAIVFCRYIPTAEYLASHLRNELGKKDKEVQIACVTGLLSPEEREARVAELGKCPRRLLIATDCLSEGINLQEHFNAVVHYDLAWNPTRHEQREGRVDRFGQPRPTVRAVSYYGLDNQIDGIVLDVLLRKHEAIRKSLGVSVPVPENSDEVMQAIIEGLLLRGKKKPDTSQQLLLPGLEDHLKSKTASLDAEWDAVAKREEKRSRTLFAQQTISVDDVARELDSANAAAGSTETVRDFTLRTLKQLGAGHLDLGNACHDLDLKSTSPRLRDLLDLPEQISASFALPVDDGRVWLSRTHPLVEKLGQYVLNMALDPVAFPGQPALARRCGAMRTGAVSSRTTLLLCRFRFQLQTRSDSMDHTTLTEEVAMLAFSGAPASAQWLDEEQTQALLAAGPCGNILPEQASGFVRKVTEGVSELLPHLRETMQARAKAQFEAHRRVRTAANLRGLRYAVSPQGEPDILGIYVFLPGKNDASQSGVSHAS